jgi:L-lactate dehydrogenase complex protein LldG
MSGDARDAVLGRVRKALGRGGRTPGGLRQKLLARLAAPQPVLIPARGNLDLDGRVRLFIAQASAVQTEVLRVERYADLPDAVVDYLRRTNLPPQLVMATDPLLQRANWAATLLEIRHGRPEDRDPAGLTTAFAGIAETGTLMLLSSPETPTTLAFLPETSMIVLPAVRVLRAYEDGFRALREEHGAMPRSVNLITGPSRSGDIEQTIQLGAHGPRRLLVLLVDELPDGSPPPDA